MASLHVYRPMFLCILIKYGTQQHMTKLIGSSFAQVPLILYDELMRTPLQHQNNSNFLWLKPSRTAKSCRIASWLHVCARHNKHWQSHVILAGFHCKGWFPFHMQTTFFMVAILNIQISHIWIYHEGISTEIILFCNMQQNVMFITCFGNLAAS